MLEAPKIEIELPFFGKRMRKSIANVRGRDAIEYAPGVVVGSACFQDDDIEFIARGRFKNFVFVSFYAFYFFYDRMNTYTDTVSVLVQYQNRYWTQTATLSAFTILSPNYPLD